MLIFNKAQAKLIQGQRTSLQGQSLETIAKVYEAECLNEAAAMIKKFHNKKRLSILDIGCGLGGDSYG